jgi:broad specificity phosphatase PhoE
VEIWIVRHGETEWSRDAKHTGKTDVELTPKGEDQARALAEVLGSHQFARVLSSPLRRARETARLAGFGEPRIDDRLVEFDYGEYDGLTTKEIRDKRPDWDLWTDGCPGGETPTHVERRADGIIDEVADTDGDVLIFAHGHCLRILAARWLALTGEDGRLFALDPATISILGYERETRVFRLWNGSTDQSVSS